MNLDILISKSEEALRVLEAFDLFDELDDGDLWFAHVDAEDVDKAIYELRKAIAKAKGE